MIICKARKTAKKEIQLFKTVNKYVFFFWQFCKLAFKGSFWLDMVVKLRNILGFIRDLSNVFTLHICSARAQIQSLKFPFGRMRLRTVYKKLYKNDHEKCNKYSTVT